MARKDVKAAQAKKKPAGVRAPTTRRETGRPTTFTQELADTICLMISEGASVRDVCKSESMPARSTVYKWLAEAEGFSDHYRIALEARADYLFDDLLEIADDSANDFVEKKYGQVLDKEAVLRAKLRVDTRKYVIERLAPKKYGPKMDLADDLKASLIMNFDFIGKARDKK